VRFGEGEGGGVAGVAAGSVSVARLVDSMVSGEAVDGCDGALTRRVAHPVRARNRQAETRFCRKFSGKKKMGRRRVPREQVTSWLAS
jgi:hypothetical protein